MLYLPLAVTTSINGMSALEELRQHPNHYDLVLSDVYMPGECMTDITQVGMGAWFMHEAASLKQLVPLIADMDGFKLLEHIGLELDLPVISERLTACWCTCHAETSAN